MPLHLINDYINGNRQALQRKMRTVCFRYAKINHAVQEGKDFKLSVILKDKNDNQFSSQHILHGQLVTDALGNMQRFNAVVAEAFAKLARRVWSYSSELIGGGNPSCMMIDKAIRGKMCKHNQRDITEALVDMEG